MLKHVDAQINLDLHQFLEPEAKYNSRREHFSEHYWGPHFSLDARTETTLDGGSIFRTSIFISLDRWSRPCNATPTTQLSTGLHQKQYIRQGQ